jgi:hypothetical protein
MVHRLTVTMAWLFAIGSTCFALGSLPVYFDNVGAAVVAMTFFVGSLFFTSAGYIQYYMSINGVGRRRFLSFRNLTPDAMASGIQSIGTLFFNISTGAALIANLSVQQEDRLIWAPDLFGSIAFLVSSAIAFGIARRMSSSVEGRRAVWWEGAVNLAGSVAFGLSAIAAVVLPTTGEPLNVAIVNAGTFIGALCFLAGALLVLNAADSAREPRGVHDE